MGDLLGNNVKIKSSPETIEAGLAGKNGVIFGVTVPSLSGVDVIGDLKEEYAVNVYFEDLEENFWFDPELIEMIDSGFGTVITLKGVDKKWTKEKNGEWKEEDTSTSKKPDTSVKKWWKFWK